MPVTSRYDGHFKGSFSVKFHKIAESANQRYVLFNEGSLVLFKLPA